MPRDFETMSAEERELFAAESEQMGVLLELSAGVIRKVGRLVREGAATEHVESAKAEFEHTLDAIGRLVTGVGP